MGKVGGKIAFSRTPQRKMGESGEDGGTSGHGQNLSTEFCVRRWSDDFLITDVISYFSGFAKSAPIWSGDDKFSPIFGNRAVILTKWS